MSHMHSILAVALLAGVQLAASCCFAKDSYTAVKSVGPWSIMASSDAMTDKLSCVALYNGKFDIQLNEDALYFSLRGKGGVSAYIARFDDLPPDKMKLPSDIDKKLSIVTFKGEAFKKVQSSKRLRLRIITVLDTIMDFDVELAEVEGARKVLLSEVCGVARK